MNEHDITTAIQLLANEEQPWVYGQAIGELLGQSRANVDAWIRNNRPAGIQVSRGVNPATATLRHRLSYCYALNPTPTPCTTHT